MVLKKKVHNFRILCIHEPNNVYYNKGLQRKLKNTITKKDIGRVT